MSVFIGYPSFMAYQMMKGKKDNNGGFPSISGMIARYSALGPTNEQMAENPVWKDLTGNGHDLQMKNFAWSGMSGVGGYIENYDSNSWIKPESRIDVTWTYKSFNVRSIKENIAAQFFRQSLRSDTGFRVLSCTIKVSGLTDGQRIDYVSNGTQLTVVGPIVIMRIENDGIYHLPSFDFGAKNAYYGFRFSKLQESCNITIEQLPLYHGALVFDGVDDYGVCENFPILTKEKGYTVVALRRFIYDGVDRQYALMTNADPNGKKDGFILELVSPNHNKYADSFGSNTILSGFEKSVFTYQTSKYCNGAPIKIGKKLAFDKIAVGTWFYPNYDPANVAIWEICILDHDATEKELQKIQDYYKQEYPWLFPDQAWTVAGKTNEDTDRATIANLTGNGNDLVLSNFGFAEGSGYGLYKTSFELYPSVQHSSKYRLSFSKFALGDHNLIIAPKQDDLSYDIKVKVTGLKDGVKFKWERIGTTGYMDITTDGIHMLNKPASQIRQLLVEFAEDFDPDHVVTIEQIPEYEGYLVTDGVDDKINSSNFDLGKDWTIVGDWTMLSNIPSNCGIIKASSLFLYNSIDSVTIYINNGRRPIKIQSKSINAICSDGRIYLNDWTEISKPGVQTELGSKTNLNITSYGTTFTKMAFKNLAIYDGKILSKDDCIKAYNYLQTLKAK